MEYSKHEMREEPRAIPILKCIGNAISLDTDALTSIFCDPKIQEKPLCIVSISGAFRKGKSFMLNFFIRYLRNEGYDYPDWMGEDDTPLNDGFDWRGGRGACTNGILVWSEVFIAIKDGEEIAILLMDTQGLFDNKTDKKTNSNIFALSTLISSVQIFNLTQQIQENDLEFLQFFTAYAQAANKASRASNVKPFQSLNFLVRDWQNAEEMAYGMDGGEKYLTEVLSEESTSEELLSVRKYLTSSFESTKCCLMPHPGEKVATASRDFTGRLKDIEKDFLHHTAMFVDSLFQPRNLVVKTINGQVVSALAMLQYVVDCGANLKDGKLPNPKTMMENVAEAQNFEVQKQCGEKYRQNMQEALGDSFVDDDFLREMHHQASTGTMQKFADMTQFGSEESRQKHWDYLLCVIEREYTMLAQINRSKKVEAESLMLQVIEDIAEVHERNLKAATEETEFLAESELQKIQETYATVAFESYSTSIYPQLKDRYFERLQSKKERIYENVKSENDEKRKIAEEQNEMERNLLKLELECAIQYRERMRRLVNNYTEEAGLDHLNDEEKRTIMDQFHMKALVIVPSPGSTMWEDHSASLSDKLDEEYKQICQINKEKKAVLMKALESERSNSYVAYDDEFRRLLKNNYVGKDDLLQKHSEVVQKLMEPMRSSVGDEAFRVPAIAQHLQEAETTLNSKYSMIEKWNKKNNSLLRKCFKIVKNVLLPVIQVAAAVAQLVTAF